MKKQNIGFAARDTDGCGDYVSKYDVKWDSPSSCSRDSMPVGDGENGLNVWAEAENGIFILIGRADTPAHTKSGRLHILTEPNVFSGDFHMETRLYDGSLKITAGVCSFEISADASSEQLGAINILVNSPREIKLTASFELWREHTIEKAPSALSELERADCLLDFADGAAWLVHSAKDGCAGELCVGGELMGDGFVKLTLSSLEKSFGGEALITAFMFADDCVDTGEWYNRLRVAELDYKSVDFNQRREAHKGWWHSFWKRSYIELSNTSDSFSITQRYILQRYIFACSSRGLLPSLYNGSVFRTELENGADRAFGWIAEQKTTSDERPWGPDYMGQNMRQQFWGLLASGDFDLFEPLIRLIRGYLPYGRREAWETMGHGGFFIPEKFTDHGFTYSQSDTDPLSEDKRLCRPEESCEKRFWHLQYHFIPTIEFTAMFVELYLYSQNERLLAEVVIPCVSECLRFYREHYPERDANGKMKIFPASTAETYGKARSGYHAFKQREDVLNPATEASGLRNIVESCKKIAEKLPAELSSLLDEYSAMLPEPPRKSYDGISLLAPGESYSPGLTCEAAELYPVFPFRNIGLSSSYSDRERAVRSYFLRRTSLDGSADIQYWETGGWHPAGLDAAMLGLSYEASRIMEINYSDSLPVISMINDSPYENRPDRPRFPGFWNYPHMDGIPDQCHGGVSMNMLETMLLSWDSDGKIYLLPAWRCDRDVRFSLRAPFDTTVECVFIGGRVASLKVTPESRAKDVVDCTDLAVQIKRLAEFKAASVNEYFGLSPMRDGTLSADDTIYRPILKPFILKYGEALCKTRPWLLQNDNVHTFYADNRLYVMLFDGADDDFVAIDCPCPISARDLGDGEPAYNYNGGRLIIDRTSCAFENKTAILRFDFAEYLQIGQVNGISCKIRASSEYGAGKAADIAPHTELFWQPMPDDESPELTLTLDSPKDIRRVEMKLTLPYDGYGIRHDFTIYGVYGDEKRVAVESAVFGRYWGQPVKIDSVEKLTIKFERASEFGVSEIRLF